MIFEKEQGNISSFLEFLQEWGKIVNLARQIGGLEIQFVNPQGDIVAGEKQAGDFCSLIQRSTLGYQKCREDYCKNCFGSEAGDQKAKVFKCHAGLTNFYVPMLVEDKVVGAIVGGGLIAQEADMRNYKKLAQYYRLDLRFFENALKNIKRIPLEEITRIGQMVKTLAQHFEEIISRHCHLLKIMDELQQANKKNDNVLAKDELTGLLNRYLFELRLNEEISRSKRYGDSLSLILVNVDHLAIVNKNYGHEVGDLLLKEVSAIISKNLRQVDILARYSGNEFALLLPRTPQHHAYLVAERVGSLVKTQIKSKLNLRVTLSAGIAAYSEKIAQENLLLEKSLFALKKAKEQGVGKAYLYAGEEAGEIQRRRVVVTGVGVVSPVGIGKETFLQALQKGLSGIGYITQFIDPGLPVFLGGEVKSFNPLNYMEAKTAQRTGKATQFAIAASKLALEDAGIVVEKEDRKRIGVIIGSAVGGLEYGEEQLTQFVTKGTKVGPYYSIAVFAGAISSETSIELGVKGCALTISTACAAANDSVGYAVNEIKSGRLDAVLTGGAEAPIRPSILNSLVSTGAMCPNKDTPERSSRPFDRLRNGFVIAEGAGILVLEELQHALRRGAHIYAEVIGYGTSGDAYHMVRPAPDGESAMHAINLALSDAHVSTYDVDYINAHGTSTPLNDKIETKIIRDLFGKHAYALAVSSTKSMLGHSIGAAGGLELAATILGLKEEFLPPTVNQEVNDPDCDLDYVPNQARKKNFATAISNSFGFGGRNSCVVMRKY